MSPATNPTLGYVGVIPGATPLIHSYELFSEPSHRLRNTGKAISSTDSQYNVVQYENKAITQIFEIYETPWSLRRSGTLHLDYLLINGCGLVGSAQGQGGAAVLQAHARGQRETQSQYPSRSLCLPTPAQPASSRHPVLSQVLRLPERDLEAGTPTQPPHPGRQRQ